MSSILSHSTMINNGRLNTTPPLVTTESSSSSTLLIDSSDRFNGTPFTFEVDLQSNIQRVRYVRLRSATIPRLNNVHSGNNTFRIKHALGTTGIITLTPGFYNTSSISNELTAKINAALALVPIVDTVVTSFNSQYRAFSITSVNAHNFFIIGDDSTTLIKYGDNLIPFTSLPEVSVPVANIIYSGISAMLPTRYLIITSNALTRYAYSRAIISSTVKQVGNIIAVIDLTNIYDDGEWDISSPYSGVYQHIDIVADWISIMNSQDALDRFIDIQLLDGYKRDLTTFYNLTAPYPTNPTLSVILNFEITF